MRTPDETHEVKIGKKTATASVWFEPTDVPWDGDIDLDPGSEGYDILVKVELIVGAHAFHARDSLGGVWILPNAEGRRYIKETALECVDEAIYCLKADIEKIAGGAEVHAAKMHQKVAQAIVEQIYA